jgi:hypothetical protein
LAVVPLGQAAINGASHAGMIIINAKLFLISHFFLFLNWRGEKAYDDARTADRVHESLAPLPTQYAQSCAQPAAQLAAVEWAKRNTHEEPTTGLIILHQQFTPSIPVVEEGLETLDPLH